jgi:hypothetical protein
VIHTGSMAALARQLMARKSDDPAAPTIGARSSAS